MGDRPVQQTAKDQRLQEEQMGFYVHQRVQREWSAR